MTSFQPLFSLRKHSASVQTCSFPLDAADHFSACTDGAPANLSHAWGHCSTPGDHEATLRSIPITQNNEYSNKLLLSGDVEGRVILWDLELRDAILEFDPVAEAAARVTLSRPGDAASDGGASNEASSGTRQCASVAGGCARGVMQVGVISVASRRGAGSGSDLDLQCTAFLYTQCRNQCLYVWAARLPSLEDDLSDDDVPGASGTVGDQADKPGNSRYSGDLQLLLTLHVPQHAFCCVAAMRYAAQQLRFAIPHDNCGLISLWEVTWELEAPRLGSSSTIWRPTATSVLDATINTGEGVKCGQIMCLSWKDALHLAVAFESGHISLHRYYAARVPPDRHPHSVQLATLRLFSEPAVSCVWNSERLLVTSAEGIIQCHLVMCDEATEEDPRAQTLLAWEVALTKGIGSCQLCGPLAVVGCWDHTLRLYDARLGSIATVAPYHAGTVNQICVSTLFLLASQNPPRRTEIAAATAASPQCMRAAAVGPSIHFGVRLSRKERDEGGQLSVIASAAADGSLAIWKALVPLSDPPS